MMVHYYMLELGKDYYVVMMFTITLNGFLKKSYIPMVF